MRLLFTAELYIFYTTVSIYILQIQCSYSQTSFSKAPCCINAVSEVHMNICAGPALIMHTITEYICSWSLCLVLVLLLYFLICISNYMLIYDKFFTLFYSCFIVFTSSVLMLSSFFLI